MRFKIAIAIVLLTSAIIVGYHPMPKGLAFSESTRADHAKLLVDETWTDAEGRRHVKQEIFDSVFEIIDEAEQFILLDFFLVNDFLYDPKPEMRPLSRELTDRLKAKRRNSPDVEIIFITDPVNTVYGSVPSQLFQSLEAAGVRVVWTDLDRLRDSNPVFSQPWRLLVNPWGNGPGNTIANPLGEGRVSLRSMMKLLNFKANHRKLIVTEKSLLVTSANPHDASSAHWNMALRIDGAGQTMACDAESAILRMSGADTFRPAGLKPETPEGGNRLELLTERRIKEKTLELLTAAAPGMRIDLTMFYLADSKIIRTLIAAKKRECEIRVILDPNKDAFGRVKDGVPNRQTAARLVKVGIPVRWADTHGEQCHVKTLYMEHPDKTATILLGSANFTRRNLDNLNAESNLAYTAPTGHEIMSRARAVFNRWWANPDSRTFTTEYKTYEDRSILRKFKARVMEATGLSSF